MEGVWADPTVSMRHSTEQPSRATAASYSPSPLHGETMDPEEGRGDIDLAGSILAVRERRLDDKRAKLQQYRKFIVAERERIERDAYELRAEKLRGFAMKGAAWHSPTSFVSPTAKRIQVRVGGQNFTVSASTLSRDPDSLLAKMKDDPLPSHMKPYFDEDSGYFVFDDRDWFLFRYILSFLRDRILPTDEELALRLYHEAHHWGLKSLEQALQSRSLGSLGYREVLSKMKKPQLKKLLVQLKKARENSRPLDDITYLDAAKLAEGIVAPEWWMQAPDWWDKNELEKAAAKKEKEKEDDRLEDIENEKKKKAKEKEEAEVMFWFDSAKVVKKVDYSKAGKDIDGNLRSAVIPQNPRLGYVDRTTAF